MVSQHKLLIGTAVGLLLRAAPAADMHYRCHRNNRANHHQPHQPSEYPQRTPWLPLAIEPADYFITTGKESQHSAPLSREYIVCVVMSNLLTAYWFSSL